MFFKWLKKYKELGYDDSVFNVKKGRPESIISDYSKIPPFIFESAGIRKDDSTNQNDTLALKRKLDYYEKILLEKEIQLRIALDQIELLKKNEQKRESREVKATYVGGLLLSLKYKSYGVCQRYLLEYFVISSSTFYTTRRTFFSNGWMKKRYKGYSMKTTGEPISDEEIEKVLVSIYENENCNEPEYYIKALGDKKLSKVLRKRYGVIVNHKKIYRMRKELGLLRKYKKHTKHARKRPKNHEVSERNKYWEADTKGLTIRTDNGPQFKSKATEAYISSFTKR